MKKDDQISNIIDGFVGIIVELSFIAGIIMTALIISYVSTGLIK